MVFSSLTFLFFFLPCTVVSYYVWPNRKWRNTILMLASLLFYAWGEPVYISLFLASSVVNWGLALAMAQWHSRKSWLLAGSIALNLLGIGVFKYAGFGMRNLNYVLGTAWSVPHIDLPIGISLHVPAISYLVDVYSGDVTPQRNPVYYAVYLTSSRGSSSPGPSSAT